MTFIEQRLHRLENKVRSIKGDQRTVFVDNLESGITIRGSLQKATAPASVGGGSSTPATVNSFPVCITGKQAGYYSVDIYANGRGNTKTGVGFMQVTMSNIGSDISTGTWMMGFTNSCHITGGSQST